MWDSSLRCETPASDVRLQPQMWDSSLRWKIPQLWRLRFFRLIYFLGWIIIYHLCFGRGLGWIFFCSLFFCIVSCFFAFHYFFKAFFLLLFCIFFVFLCISLHFFAFLCFFLCKRAKEWSPVAPEPLNFQWGKPWAWKHILAFALSFVFLCISLLLAL